MAIHPTTASALAFSATAAPKLTPTFDATKATAIADAAALQSSKLAAQQRTATQAIVAARSAETDAQTARAAGENPSETLGAQIDAKA